MKASLFASARDHDPTPWEGDWAAFCRELVADPLPAHPDPAAGLSEADWKAAKALLPAWSPACYREGARRSNRNVAAVSAFVVDLDDVPAAELPDVLERFQDHAYLAHTTPSAHRAPAGLVRLRLILPLITAVVGADWPKVWRALAERFELPGEPWFDDSCSDAARLYFLPVEGVRWFTHDGAFLEATAREPITRRDLTEIGQALSRRKGEDDKALGRAFRSLAIGEMYAQHPHRDETMKRVTWHLACKRPNLDPDSIVSVFAASMAAPGALPDDPDAERVKRLYLDAIEKVELPRVVAADPKRLREAWYPVDRETPYDDEEIAGWDEHEWLLMFGKSVYLRAPHGYVGPYGFEDGKTAALTYLSPAPIDLHKPTQSGFRQKTITELAEHYGRAIGKVAVDLNAQAPRYDKDRDTFYEAPCPLRGVYEPVYHPEVHEWLRVLAGAEWPKLAAWLYWLTMLDRPCAALYLCGAADTGKSLLATELAKLWSANGVTTLETAIDTFNDAILTCPLVFGDEFVPKDKGDEIKRFVSERDRPCKRKFLPVARMIGSTRLILAANNLRFADLYGDLTDDDISAFLDRFVGIDVEPAAADVLRRYDVGRWVEMGAIPRFALWVREHVPFEPEGRFLVRGSRETKLRRALATRTGTRALICEWLAAFVANPKRGLTAAQGGIVIDDGQILLTAPAIRDIWTTYSDEPRPRIGHINHAVGALTTCARAVINDRRYRIVDLELFGAWCEEQDLFSRAELKKILDGARPKA